MAKKYENVEKVLGLLDDAQLGGLQTRLSSTEKNLSEILKKLSVLEADKQERDAQEAARIAEEEAKAKAAEAAAAKEAEEKAEQAAAKKKTTRKKAAETPFGKVVCLYGNRLLQN